MTEPTRDPIEVLNEIVKVAMDRMNSSQEISGGEAFVLGQISGLAMRVPGVRIRDDDE